jgi:hypothetical protein
MSRGSDRSRLPLAVIAVLGALLAFLTVGGSVWALYSGPSTSSGNQLVAATDWVAPTASASTISKSQGGIPGFIHQGGAYSVYAAVADAGAPAGGVASVSGNLSSTTTGQTAAALSSGSFTVGGSSYGYGSASLTANSTLSAGSYTYSLTSKDAAGNSRTQSGYPVTVENTAPTASDIQTTNKAGNTASKPELGDTAIFTFSEQIDPSSILSGWSGAATNVVVRITNSGNDTLTVFNAANATQLPLGSVSLGRNDYVTTNVTFGATGTASSMVQSTGVITITLGTPTSGTSTSTGNSTMVWSPSASAYDRAGNAMSTSTRTETGGNDREF